VEKQDPEVISKGHFLDDIQILIRGCLKNNRKAQEEMYKRFYPAMMGICIRYTRNEHDAVEVLNDGFLKAFLHIDQYDVTKATFYTWLRRIMLNTAIDLGRRQEGYHQKGILSGEQEEGIENEAIQKLRGEDLLKMIRQLPAATRLVFNLYTIEGFNHREIASMLEISEGTSRWHLSEARQKLKLIINLMETHP
jgi:RNA polymerase sigma-70 factor (ECF subfamily)